MSPAGQALHDGRCRRGRILSPLVVAALLLFSGLTLVGDSRSFPHPVSVAGASGYGDAVLAGAPLSSSGGSASTDASRLATVEADRDALVASGGNLSEFEPPALQQAPPLVGPGGTVTPLYVRAPAPMGVAYYGLQNVSGTLQGTVLNTTTLRGYFETNDTLGVETESLSSVSSSDFGVQLNAVLTNVTIGGRTGFAPNQNAPHGCLYYFTGSRGNWCPNEFWLQNVFNYDPTTQQLTFEDNIWNFSNPSVNWLTSNGATLAGRGTPLAGFYAVAGPTFRISYPFTVVLYLNSTAGQCTTGSPGASSCAKIKTGGPVDEVYFNYTVLDASGHVVCPTVEPPNSVCGEFDDVYWNSISHSIDPSGVQAGSAVLTADGTQYDPTGLTNDWELDVGVGASGGATALVAYADAQVGLGYCPRGATDPSNGKCSRYAAPPSGFDAGGETGETCLGEGAVYAYEGVGTPVPASLAGPGAPVERLVAGPSLVRGLWNLSMPVGASPLNYASIAPANAWVGIAAGAARMNQSAFQIAPTFGWYSSRSGSGGSHRSTGLGPSLYLSPGVYTVEVLLSGYDAFRDTVDLRSGGATPYISLLPDPSTGVYTPMWAFSSGDLANLSTSGAGTVNSPYLLVNGSAPPSPYGPPEALATVFASLNDYLYPVWVGAYVNATRAFARFSPAPEFSVHYPTWDWPALSRLHAPRANQLPYDLFRAQNLTVTGALNLSVWASYLAAPDASVVCKGCFNDLFALNTFHVSDVGLELGGAVGSMRGQAAYANYPHSRNVVWGNTFLSFPQSAGTGLLPPTTFVGEFDSNDRIYNNDFGGNVSVSEPSSTAVDAWNVTCQAGYSGPSTGEYPGPVPCEPVSYAVSMNGQSLSGGIDHIPYQGGNLWTTFGGFANPYANIPFVDRPTSYTQGGIAPPSGGLAGDFAPLLAFRVYDVPFVEGGLPVSSSATAFGVSLQGTQTWENVTPTLSPARDCPGVPCLRIFVPNGSYAYQATTNLRGYTASPRVGSVTVAGAALARTSISFARARAVSLTIREKGISPGVSWCASLDAYRECTLATKLGFTGLTPGSYAYAIVRPTANTTLRLGRTAEPLSGSIDLSHSRSLVLTHVYVYKIEFHEAGLSSGNWSLKLNGVVYTVPWFDSLTFFRGNGTYRYHIVPLTGYSASGAPGRAVVRGTGVQVVVSYAPRY
jgi:Thermopsin